jgi:SAM-dependent methyltransferase
MIATAQAIAYWTPTPADLPNVERVARHYWDSIDAPHRFWVLEAVALLGGAERVLEVGCQSGPNLRALARTWPTMRLDGLEVNPWAIEAGRRYAAEEGFSGLHFHQGALPGALAAWPDRSVDIALSVYCLAYLNGDDIIDTVRDLLRVARKGIVLIEPMTTSQDEAEELTTEGSQYVEWRHDYLGLLHILATDLPAGHRLHAVVLPRQAVDRLKGVIIVAHRRDDR